MIHISDYNIILASNSPRRKELLKGLDIDFSVHVIPDLEENWPKSLANKKVAEFLAKQKSEAYLSLLDENTLIITADTVVICNGEILGKPRNLSDAKQLLHKLSGKTHQVVTGVCLTTKHKQKTFSETTAVSFSSLSDEEINFYVEKYKPMDKAGAYGVQEWIGYVAVKRIEGSFYNVMGLPVQRLYRELILFK